MVYLYGLYPSFRHSSFSGSSGLFPVLPWYVRFILINFRRLISSLKCQYGPFSKCTSRGLIMYVIGAMLLFLL